MPSMWLGFRYTLVNRTEQGGRLERLAQTARRSQPGSNSKKVGRGCFGIGKGRSRDRDQRHRGGAVMKHPDRLEAPHVGHEDVDDHQIECGMLQSGKAADAAVGDGNPEAMLPEPNADGLADMWIVIDHENTAHGGPVRSCLAFSNAPHCHAFASQQRISVQFLFPPQTWRDVCPPPCIAAWMQLFRIAVICFRKTTRNASAFYIAPLGSVGDAIDQGPMELPPSRQGISCLPFSGRPTDCCKRFPRRNSRRSVPSEARRNGQRGCPGRIGRGFDARLPAHAGTVSLVVNLSEGQTVEVAVTVFRRLTRSCCFPAPPRSSTSPTSG